MGLPQKTISLSPETIADLNRRLGDMRHNVNNHLTLVTTAMELIRRKPDSIERMLETMEDQPDRIRAELHEFSAELEKILGISAE
jgi:hypothetical protein